MNSYDSKTLQDIHLTLLDIKQLIQKVVEKQDKSEDLFVNGINVLGNLIQDCNDLK